MALDLSENGAVRPAANYNVGSIHEEFSLAARRFATCPSLDEAAAMVHEYDPISLGDEEQSTSRDTVTGRCARPG